MGRVHMTFWALVIVAVLATGALSRSLSWSFGPMTALTITVSGVLVVISVLLALRILVVVARRG